MVLLAASWLTGEYCALLESPESALELMSQKSVAKLDPAIQATYLQSMLKIFAFWMNGLQYSWNEEARQSLVEMIELLHNGVNETFSRSPDLEVQERVCFSRQLFITPTIGLKLQTDLTSAIFVTSGLQYFCNFGYYCRPCSQDSYQDCQLYLVCANDAYASLDPRIALPLVL